jgi:hypothetical protein
MKKILMKRKKQIHDPRELLADKLNKAGIDVQKACFIALDAGGNLVDKEYLIDLGLRGAQLKVAESLVKEFYWGDTGPV